MTYQLIAQTSSYAPFSNTGYSDGRGGQYNSIENSRSYFPRLSSYLDNSTSCLWSITRRRQKVIQLIARSCVFDEVNVDMSSALPPERIHSQVVQTWKPAVKHLTPGTHPWHMRPHVLSLSCNHSKIVMLISFPPSAQCDPRLCWSGRPHVNNPLLSI